MLTAHLVETPLSEDQVIESVDADHVCVTATVRDTAQLEWWLLGFGSSVLVLEPVALAVRIADATQSVGGVTPEKLGER